MKKEKIDIKRDLKYIGGALFLIGILLLLAYGLIKLIAASGISIVLKVSVVAVVIGSLMVLAALAGDKWKKIEKL